MSAKNPNKDSSYSKTQHFLFLPPTIMLCMHTSNTYYNYYKVYYIVDYILYKLNSDALIIYAYILDKKKQKRIHWFKIKTMPLLMKEEFKKI